MHAFMCVRPHLQFPTIDMHRVAFLQDFWDIWAFMDRVYFTLTVKWRERE